jgi:hypothetical protein
LASASAFWAGQANNLIGIFAEPQRTGHWKVNVRQSL